MALFGNKNNDKKKKKSLFGNSSSNNGGGSQFSTDSLDRQISNAETRIRAAGYAPVNADKRNWFEKATNLPEGQNAFFDVLDLLDRPGNAIRTAIHEKDDSNIQELWQGFSGKKKTRGTDLLDESGNKVLDGLAGFALEVVTDPTSLIPSGAIAKGIKGTGGLTGKALTKIPLSNKTTEALTPAYNGIKDSLGYMFNTRYGRDKVFNESGELVNGEDILSPMLRRTDNAMTYDKMKSLENIQNAAKTAGGYDKGDLAGRIMEKDLTQFEEFPGYQLPDGRITQNKGDIWKLQNDYKRAKTETGKQINLTKKSFDEAETTLKGGLSQVNKEIDNLFFQLEKNAYKGIDEGLKSNLKSARSELNNTVRQLNNLDPAAKSYKKYLEKTFKDSHEAKFDVLKDMKKYAPNGIKPLQGFRKEDYPTHFLRINKNGAPFDVVAQEMGYDANELLKALKNLDVEPRKLDRSTLSNLADGHLDKSGYFKQISKEREGLEKQKQAYEDLLMAYAKDSKNVRLDNMAQATTKAFDNLSNHSDYQSLLEQKKALESQIKGLGEDKGKAVKGIKEQIKFLDSQISELEQIKQSPNATVKKLFDRPVREIPTDEGTNQAARMLIESNDVIRQQAEELGISVGELEGYMRHILSKEEVKLRKQKGGSAYGVDKGNYGLANPNDKFLKQRQLLGSAEDVNDQLGRKFFETNAFFSTAAGQKQLIEYMHAASLRREILSNPKLAIKWQPGMNVVNGTVKINTKNYQFMKDADMQALGLADEVGGEYLVPLAVKTSLDRYQRALTDEGSKAFLKAFDTVQSWWKRAALFSVPYHLRNDIGAKFNNWVGGMNTADIVRYSSKADAEVYRAMVLGKPSKVYDEYLRQGLGASSQSKVEFKQYGEEFEKELERMLKEGSKSMGGKVATRLNPMRAFETSRELGDFIDQTNRFALYLWARNKKGLTPEKAADKVREIQFDYTELTNFEKEVVARVIPFYRWMKNNIPFQIRSFVNDPRKYQNVNRLRLNLQESFGIDEETQPDYMKESFALPLTGDGTGTGKMLGLNLPLGDLTKLSNPGKMFVDSLTPIGKLPLEVSMNRNFFYDRPIEKFEGDSKQFGIPGTDMSFGVPKKSAYIAEQLTGQIGRGLSGYLQKPEETNLDSKFRTPSFGISSILKDYDVNKANYYDRLEELRKLQDLMYLIEQQTGKRPPTLNDLR